MKYQNSNREIYELTFHDLRLARRDPLYWLAWAVFSRINLEALQIRLVQWWHQRRHTKIDTKTMSANVPSTFFRFRTWHLGVVVAAIYGVGVLCAGFYFTRDIRTTSSQMHCIATLQPPFQMPSARYFAPLSDSQRPKCLTTVWSPIEFASEALINVIFIPLVWVVYVWQPIRVEHVMRGLRQNSITALNPDENGGCEAESECLGMFDRWGTPIMSLVLACGLTAIWRYGLRVDNPHPWDELAKYPLWFTKIPERHWYFPLYIIFDVWFPAYAGVSLVLRHLAICRLMTRVFSRFKDSIRLSPFHEDGRNGFGGYGDYLMWMDVLILLFGGWLTFLTFATKFSTHHVNVNYYTAGLLIIYIAFVISFIARPTADIGAAMEEARRRALLRWESELGREVSSCDTLEKTRPRPGRASEFARERFPHRVRGFNPLARDASIQLAVYNVLASELKTSPYRRHVIESIGLAASVLAVVLALLPIIS